MTSQPTGPVYYIPPGLTPDQVSMILKGDPTHTGWTAFHVAGTPYLQAQIETLPSLSYFLNLEQGVEVLPSFHTVRFGSSTNPTIMNIVDFVNAQVAKAKQVTDNTQQQQDQTQQQQQQQQNTGGSHIIVNSPIDGKPIVDIDLSGIQAAIDSVGSAIASIGAFIGGIGTTFKNLQTNINNTAVHASDLWTWIGNSHTLARIGAILLGAILMIIGVNAFIMSFVDVKEVVKTATSAAAVAA